MKDTVLKSVTCEELGFSSKWVENMLDEIEAKKICLHSFIILRHGKIGAEGYWGSFSEEKLHRMYSVSKTFTSAAIGILAGEGRISLDDKIAKYFPDKIPSEGLHPYVEGTTIKNLLTMTTPYNSVTYGIKYKDWAWTFFNATHENPKGYLDNVFPDHPAGTVFNYDTAGTYILDCIVERVTGMPFLKYLRDKLLDPIGFSKETWCIKSPEGNSWGGSGVMCTSRDLAKFSQVFINGGKFNGKQLIPEDYVKEAVYPHVQNCTDGNFTPFTHGYGYQIWCGENGVFAFLGMGDQLALIFPKHDTILITTADTQGMDKTHSEIYYSFKNNIIKNLSNSSLPSDEAAQIHLNERCKNLKLPVPEGKAKGAFQDKINGKAYILDRNVMEISKIMVTIDGDEGVLCYTNPRGDKKIRFGMLKHVEDFFPETHYFGDTIGKSADRMFKTTSAAAWFNDHNLLIRIYIVDDCFGNLSISLSFKDDKVGVLMHKNAEFFLDEYQGFAGGLAE